MSKKPIKFISLSSIILALFFYACNGTNNKANISQTFSDQTQPKYIFMFIGDGMSFTQVNIAKAAQQHENFRLHKKPGFGKKPMHLTNFPISGIATTFATDRYITESSAAGTALATGYKTSCGTVSMSPDHSQSYKTIAEMARDKGMKVGIISSVSIDHATPACFYAHTKDRGNYNNIATQMADSKFDYFGGGFAKGALPQYLKKENSKDILQYMQQSGYKIITSKEQLMAVNPGDKYWAYNENYDNDAALQYEIDQEENYIRLADFTEQGIRLLDNEKGFFMMVESGKIDWACHANDAVTAAHEVVALDESIGKALDFYKKHPEETLIIVTGDHECGGLALGYSAAHYQSAFEILNYQKISFEHFSHKVYHWKNQADITKTMVMDSISYYFGLNDQDKHALLKLSDYELKRLNEAYALSFNQREKENSEEYYISYGSYDPLTVTVTHLLNQKAGIDWASYSHTAVPVPVYAIGIGQELFSGQLDNTDISKKIIKLAQFN